MTPIEKATALIIRARGCAHYADRTNEAHTLLTEALAALEGMGDGWRGIETAPINEMILVWSDRDEVHKAIKLPSEEGFEWWYGLCPLPEPTRWMPLPAPPSKEPT